MTSNSRRSPVTELIRLSAADLDRPLHRIYPLWFLEDALRVNGGRLVLVTPTVWEDPYEDLGMSFLMDVKGQQKGLGSYLSPIYAQCWSFEGDSDALLRAYSRVTKDKVIQRNLDPRNEGVRVTTSPRKLISAVEAWLDRRPEITWSFYLGAIEYRDDCADLLAGRLRTIGPTRLGRGVDRAQSILIKRTAFQHESEIRLICVTDAEDARDNISVDVNPNELFTEIQFDPRLVAFERREREKLVRSLGYEGKVGEGLRYVKTLFQVFLDKPWDELDLQATASRGNDDGGGARE